MLWIVRVLRAKWYTPDYVGMYRAATAVQAMSLAGADEYMAKIMGRKVVRVEAVAADFTVEHPRPIRTAQGVAGQY